MASLETTELKLTTTPTGGVDAAQSPYYRRLLSAGYKGFLQGTIGGAGLYGAMGLVIGGLVIGPLFATGYLAGGLALSLFAAAGGLGLVKGATTFGNIGSVAAINAESADLSEQRRYLLDRYYELPEGPAGDREAAAIKAELERRAGDVNAPSSIFHWKTAAIGAAIGAALVLGGLAATGVFGAGGATALIALVKSIFGVAIPEVTAGVLVASTVGLAATGAAAGALAGAVIGIDRYYIRKWFDHTQDVVHSSSHRESALLERQQQVERLHAAAKEDAKVKAHMDGATENSIPTSPTHNAAQPTTAPYAKPVTKPTASLSETPATKISSATLQSRLADVQKTMEIAAF